MISLLIDTSTSHVAISIIKDNRILNIYQENIISDMSSKILPIISNMLLEVNLELNDIDKIFIVNGPGSFTGIRVGVTVAKTLAWALNKKIVTISSLELMATTNTNKKYLVPMIDARRGNVFAGIYDSNLNCIKEDKLVNLKNYIDGLSDEYEFISYDDIDLVDISKPNINILKIVEKYSLIDGMNPHNVNPNYLKLTEAEEKLGNSND